MRKTKTGLSVAACLAASVAIAPAAFGQAAEIIYDNSQNRIGSRTSPQNAEIGDIVNFAGSQRILAEFSFEYFLTGGTDPSTAAQLAPSGNEMAQIFLRAVTDDIVPSTILYQSQPFSLTSGFNTVHAEGLSIVVPDTVAWTILFSGFEGTEEAGLLYASPPTVGSSPTFNGSQFIISRNADGSFAILDTPGLGADNLIARFTAIPEPSTWALILGGLAGFGLLRRRS